MEQGAFQISAGILRMLDCLERAGFQSYLVGGCVRDFLLGRQPKDVDLTTNALPEQVRAVFVQNGYEVIDTGIAHGTVTVLAPISGNSEETHREPVEITTFRVDGTYSDSRRPDFVKFSASLEEDLARRDFTINALAYHPNWGILDFFGGQEDLRRGILRTVGTPQQRFAEDGLRILRGLRFAAVLESRLEPGNAFEIDWLTMAAMKQEAQRLKLISVERIAVELMKLLCGPHVKQVLKEGADILQIVIPQISKMRGFRQNNPYHIYDVWEHTIEAVASIAPDPVLRLTMLLHDSGKPECYSEDQVGVGHFYGHAIHSERLAEEIIVGLKWETYIKQRVCLLIKYHDSQIQPDKKIVKRWLNRMGKDAFLQLLAVKRADVLAQSPEVREQRLHDLNKLKRLAEEIIDEEDCFSLKQLAVTGNDLIEAGVPEGRQIGLILNEMLMLVIDEQIYNSKESLLQFLEKRQGGQG